MVNVVKGNMFDSDAQVLVNTINCVGAMGKGIALTFKRLYPLMYKQYKTYCDKGMIKPGILWLYKDKETGQWVLNFPTKLDWRNPSKMEYIESGLQKFLYTYKEKGIKSIAFPLLGCSNGGLNANDVIPLMERYLSQCEDCDITIYDNR